VAAEEVPFASSLVVHREVRELTLAGVPAVLRPGTCVSSGGVPDRSKMGRC
jgi:hypothetical protein